MSIGIQTLFINDINGLNTFCCILITILIYWNEFVDNTKEIKRYLFWKRIYTFGWQFH